MKEANFFIGQIVHHRKFDYRGVIFDVDPVYSSTDEWYDMVAKSRPPKDEPWYHVLVDNSHKTTYVAERNLEATDSTLPIQHPLINHYFESYTDGQYFSNQANN